MFEVERIRHRLVAVFKRPGSFGHLGYFHFILVRDIVRCQGATRWLWHTCIVESAHLICFYVESGVDCHAVKHIFIRILFFAICLE